MLSKKEIKRKEEYHFYIMSATNFNFLMSATNFNFLRFATCIYAHQGNASKLYNILYCSIYLEII